MKDCLFAPCYRCQMVIRGAALAALAVLLTSGVALAQQASVAGTVRDQTGAPLPGVTVEPDRIVITRAGEDAGPGDNGDDDDDA